MITEMLFIHQFDAYFENPTYSVAIVLAMLLLSSGLGSYFSNKKVFAKKLWIAPLCIALLLFFSTIIIAPFISLTISSALMYRIIICMIIVGSIGFFMGIPFPSVTNKIASFSPNYIPSVWAINGLFSVVATPLAVILSAEMGFTSLISFGALCYLVATWAASRNIL